ncbi:MAG: M81 family metallopeptidase [Rhodospirillales bacterium]|jgi:microcystin degradation protein MlrC|nr:M81 family metallopeptidase [Rhodospirillales bacterium]
MKRRAVVAMMEHETNTFSPVPTPLSRFGSPELPTGKEVYRRYKGTGTGLGGLLDVADREGMDIVTPVAGNAAPSGHVDAHAFANMCDAICDSVAAGCDVCFLDLHGAMVAETTDDGEGTLLRRIREIAPDLPIAASFDLHANITQDIIDNCSVLVGYKTYPHIDMYEAGEHAGNIMVRALNGEIKPIMTWGQRPILAQTLRMGHGDRPMGPMIKLAREEEANGLLAASVFGGFPLADFHDAGLSVVTIADDDAALAEAACNRLLSEAWREKDGWLFHSEPLSETISKAKQITGGPVVLLDHADNSASGGTQDTMAVIKEIIEQELEDVAVFGVCDPVAVSKMEAAGVGSDITIDLGGKVDMPDIGMDGEPLRISGKIRAITDGDFIITVPMGRGTRESMGKTAVLDTGKVQIVVCSDHTEPFDLGCFRSVGIEPTEKRYLVLKSRIHYRAGFQAIASHEIPCNGVGVTSSDNSLFKFKKVRRPIYPLDPDCPELPNYEMPS